MVCVGGYCAYCTFFARFADVCGLDIDRRMDFDIVIYNDSVGVGIGK